MLIDVLPSFDTTEEMMPILLKYLLIVTLYFIYLMSYFTSCSIRAENSYRLWMSRSTLSLTLKFFCDANMQFYFIK